MNGFYRFIRALMIFITKWLLPLKVIGAENIPHDGGCLVCSNHTSMSDVIYLIVSSHRKLHFMGKAEIFRLPLLGYLFRKLGVFPVNRGHADRGAVEYAIQLVRDGKPVGIFPEGTRNKVFGPPMRGKSGAVVIAASAGVPIVPAAICRTGKFSLFRPTTLRYGTPIPADQLAKPNEGKEALKQATDTLMNKITALWEMGR